MLVVGASTLTVVLSIAGAIAVLGGAYAGLKSFGGDAIRAVRALSRFLPSRDAVHGADVEVVPAEPSKDQIRALNEIHDQTLHHGEPPTFRALDKTLDLEGLRLRALVESMPPGLMRPDAATGPRILREDDRLSVTLDGLRYCDGGGAALTLLARTLAYLAERERPFMPTPEEPNLIVTSDEVRRDLGLTETDLRAVRVLIYMYSHQSWTGMSGQAGQWTITVSSEYVRRFRGVRDGEQYLRATTGESFDRQLVNEEANVDSAGDEELLSAAVRLRASLEEQRQRIALALPTHFYWTEPFARDVFDHYEPVLTRRPRVHRVVSDAFLLFNELNQRVPLGE